MNKCGSREDFPLPPLPFQAVPLPQASCKFLCSFLDCNKHCSVPEFPRKFPFSYPETWRVGGGLFPALLSISLFCLCSQGSPLAHSLVPTVSPQPPRHLWDLKGRHPLICPEWSWLHQLNKQAGKSAMRPKSRSSRMLLQPQFLSEAYVAGP